MKKRLPVLLKVNNEIYDEIELKKPSGRVLSDTKEAVDRTSSYMAARNFVAGCTVSLFARSGKTVEDPIAIKALLGKSSNKNLEYFAQEIMVDYYNGEDFIEGVYPCPRCGSLVIAEKRDADGIEIDNRDRISNLKVNFMEDPSDLCFELELTKPVILKTQMQEEQITVIKMGFPTIEDCVDAYSSVGDSNPVKFQYELYARALIEVNGQEVDKSWKRSFGVQFFNNIEEIKIDIGFISDWINAFGVQPEVEKTCMKCGKVWQPFINTSNFFDFAPR